MKSKQRCGKHGMTQNHSACGNAEAAERLSKYKEINQQHDNLKNIYSIYSEGSRIVAVTQDC